MKTSNTFREDRQPAARAKVPISILSLPFLCGVSAGGDYDSCALRLDLATAFGYGPSVRLSYRPSDAANPLSLVLKSGAGSLGSPLRAPFSISAEFKLLSADAPSGLASFSLLFKPRLGDFSIKKTVRSSSSAAVAPSTPTKTDSAGCADGQTLVNGSETPQLNGFPMDIEAFGAGRGEERLDGLISGFEITAKSVLHLPSCATVSFRWGIRAPTKLRNEFDGRIVSFSLRQFPLLVMKKISVEHVADGHIMKDKKVDASNSNVADASGTVTLKIEKLQAEYSMLRKVTEELRSELDNWKLNSPRPERPIVTKGITKATDSMVDET